MFINKTPSSINEYKNFLFMHNEKKLTCMNIILSIVVIIGAIICFFSLPIGFGIVLAGILIGVLFSKSYKKLVVRGIEKIAVDSPFIGENVYKIFTFNENEIEVTVENQGIAFANAKYDYSNITKVVVRKENIFIYISEQEALIINPNLMIKGKFEDLEEFLKNKNIKFQV